ncbi:hypothetical protein A9Q96_08890 [Rhodobacterales bacterium 52_120_T64]|nr:hypothetical protein A9Q96_08890 [Rhodobacterales bacterium 52_120_T64]
MGLFPKTIVVACTALGLASCSQMQTDDTFASAKAASEKYRDVDVALAAGYIPDPSGECVESPAGGMGIHYLNMALLEVTRADPRVDGTGTHTDFLNPAILLYEPQEDGSLELVGIENLVFQASWAAAGYAYPPSYGGSEWDAMADNPDTDMDEAHGFTPHYDRHVWVFRDNPAGMIAPFNSNVSCEFH